MNRIDRQNLSFIADSVNSASPIGLNTATGTPDLGASAGRQAVTVADDATLPVGRTVLQPKPDAKFAQEENFGTVPVGTMNNHGDYTGPGLTPPAAGNVQNGSQQTSVIRPKPDAKFAQEENFGTVPVGMMNSHGDYTGPGLASPAENMQSSSRQEQIIAPKPGSKFALPQEEDECGAMPLPFSVVQSAEEAGAEEDAPPAVPAFSEEADMSVPPVQPAMPGQSRSTASVPDDVTIPNSSGILYPKPESKFAAGSFKR